MAGTLVLGLSLNDTFGTSRRVLGQDNLNIAITNNARKSETISVTNTGQGETVPLGDVTSPMFIRVKNNDATNAIEWGIDNAGNIVVMGRLLPGIPYLIPMYSGITYRVRALVTACEMEYDIWST